MTTQNNHTLQSLQKVLLTTAEGDDLAFIQNFRSLAATDWFLEDCLEEYDDGDGSEQQGLSIVPPCKPEGIKAFDPM